MICLMDINTYTVQKLKSISYPDILYDLSLIWTLKVYPKQIHLAGFKLLSRDSGSHIAFEIHVHMFPQAPSRNCKQYLKQLIRTSDGGNRSHNVSLPIILKKTKVGQILQYSCISLLLVPILLYWIQVSVSLKVLLYFGAEMDTFCIKHIENRKIFF